MEEILQEWEVKSSQIQRLEGTFTRITYNGVFGKEYYAEGKFCFAYPDKGSFQQEGSRIAVGAKGRKYPAESGEDQRWVCDGERILKINDKERQFEQVTIREEDRGQNIRNSPLPFLFGMKASEAKQRYGFELVAKGTNAKQVHLKVFPRLQQDLANYKMAEVLLDRENYVPKAVKLYDTTGTTEDVYSFPQDGLTINERSWKQWLGGDPLKPKLTGFKELVEPVGQAKSQQLAPRPTDRRTTSTTPGTRTAARPQLQRTAELPADDERPTRVAPRTRPRP